MTDNKTVGDVLCELCGGDCRNTDYTRPHFCEPHKKTLRQLGEKIGGAIEEVPTKDFSVKSLFGDNPTKEQLVVVGYKYANKITKQHLTAIGLPMGEGKEE